MKILKVAIGILIVTALVVSAACTSGSSSATPKTQLLTVQRGDLSTDITAAGNLALSNKQDLVIEISGTQQDPVTVQEVLVKEGDSVKKGQVVVKLNVTTLETKVTNQQRVVKTAEQSVKTAQSSLNKTLQDSDIQIKQAQMDLETATITFNRLNYPFNFSTFAFDMPAAIANLRDARRQLEEAQAGLAAGPGADTYGKAMEDFRRAQENLTAALERLSKGLGISVYSDTAGPSDNRTYSYVDVSPTVSNYLTARAAKISVEKAQNSLEQAKSSIQINIDRANLTLDNAKEDLSDARDTLADYETDWKKSEVIAPFDGFITKVNVVGGDAVQRGTIAAQLADPAKFQADIMVSEMDILQVKLGGDARVQVTAMSGLTLSAKVIAISPTATIQSGVVNYKVTVEVASIESIMQQRQAARQEAAQQSPQGDATARNRPATGPASTNSTRQASGFTMISDNLQLKEGLTITVSIVLEQRNNVLQVPNTAITRQGAKSYVKVSNGGTIEEREIKTGISNWQYTEVTEGLKEGEKVVVPQGTTTSSTQQQRQQGPMGGMPGGIRIIR